jgi:SAM-dependent methyltransferase
MRCLLAWSVALLAGCAPPVPPPAPTASPAANSAPTTVGSEVPAGGETETSPEGPDKADHPGTDSNPGSHHEFHRPTHRFEDAEAWSQVFDSPERDTWQKPDEVIEQLELAPDARVADVGAGTGYFTVRLARAVPRGKVVAVDVEPNLVAFIEQRASREGLTNVEAKLAPADDPRLPPDLDLVLVVNTYHHIAERPAYFAKVRQSLAADGRLVLVEWRMGKQAHGPPDDHKLPPDVITRELSEAGFRRCREWDGLPHQHVLFYGVKC